MISPAEAKLKRQPPDNAAQQETGEAEAKIMGRSVPGCRGTGVMLTPNSRWHRNEKPRTHDSTRR